MDNQEVMIAIAEQGAQIKELCRRMDSMEKLVETVNKMAINTERISASLKITETSVDTLTKDVKELKEKPGKRWDALVAAGIAALVGGFIGHLI